MDFDLITLRLFEAVVRLGSISAAAEEQNIAVSAVSRRFSDLEHRLGTAVLYRKVRGVAPTPAGEVLLRHAGNILRLAERASAELADYAEGDRGQVRVAANPSAIAEFLPAVFASFRDKHPAVKLALAEQMSDDIVHDIADGQVDVGIFSAVVRHDGIEAFPFVADRLCVIAPAGHPIAARDGVRFVDILDYPHVGLEDGSSLFRQFAKLAEDAGRVLELAVRVRSFDGVRRMVVMNLGLGILPRAVVEPYAVSDGLAVVELREDWSERGFMVGVRERAALSGAAARFLEHLLSSKMAG